MALDIVLRKFYESIKATRTLSNYPTTLDIARNKIPTARPFQIEGYRADIGTTTEDISELSTSVIPVPPLSGITMQVVSTSANDTLAGTNSQKVTIEYIEPTTEILTQIEVSLNGTTPVTIPVPIAFVSDFYVSQSATLDTVSAGDITIFNGSTVYNIIKAGGNKSQCCMRYVPKGKVVMITSIQLSGTTKGSSLRLRANITDNFTRTTGFLFRTNELISDAPNSTYYDPPIVIPQQTYLKMSSFGNGGAVNGNVSVTISGFIENVGSLGKF